MKIKLASFCLGFLFALGLGVSGMTNPQKVLGFLDLAGAWDPSLALVMVGAIGVAFFPFRVYTRMARPLLMADWAVPPRGKPDLQLLLGSLIFGTGWGLAGICPGPAITALGFGNPLFLDFVLALSAGMLFFDWVIQSRSRRLTRASI